MLGFTFVDTFSAEGHTFVFFNGAVLFPIISIVKLTKIWRVPVENLTRRKNWNLSIETL